MKLYQQIAQTFTAWQNCSNPIAPNGVWMEKHETRINELTREYLPSGSGFDSGTEFKFIASQPNKLVFKSAFHHMDEYGGYDGWSEFDVIVTPDLAFGFNLRLRSTGKFARKYADTKEYILEVFQTALDQEVTPT